MRTTISSQGRAGVFSSAGGREQECMCGLCCVDCACMSGGRRMSVHVMVHGAE